MSATRIVAPLFVRRSVPLPTWRGWLLIVTLIGAGMCFVPHALYTFLATTNATGGGVLVIEGWMEDNAVADGVSLYRSGRYDRIVTTGVPIDYGSFLSAYGSTAEAARATCIHMGIDSGSVHAAAAHGHILRDRTLASAYALRAWLQRNAPGARQVDILSQGVHARRTHMIFARVLGDSMRVGIIAAPDTRYGADDWWMSSAGGKDVGGEVVGYIYAAIGRDQPPPQE